MGSGEASLLALDVLSVVSWPYAPSTLRQLRQPIPNDLPRQYDSTIFTFEDAFEDLLVVSQSKPLPDINYRYSQRMLLRRMFPAGEPTWFWGRRLESQGLLRRPMLNEAVGIPWLDWGEFHRDLEQLTTEVWKNVANLETDGSPQLESAQKRRPLEVWGLDGSVKRQTNQCGHHKMDSEEIVHMRHEPDNFDDLFTTISSSFAKGEQTWDTFLKLISENRPGRASKSWPSATGTSDGKEEAVSQDEHIDKSGYLHTTVTRQIFDSEGDHIGSETHVAVRPVKKTLELNAKNEDAEGELPNRSEQGNETSNNKKLGWFWK